MPMLNPELGIDLLVDADGDLTVAPDGDLDITLDGRTCLMQDVAALLDTLPGELFGHAEYGAGLQNLVGEESEPGFENRIKRVVEDALIFEDSVAGRVDADSVAVTVTTSNLGQDASITVEFAPADDPENVLNLVWPNASQTE